MPAVTPPLSSFLSRWTGWHHLSAARYTAPPFITCNRHSGVGISLNTPRTKVSFMWMKWLIRFLYFLCYISHILYIHFLTAREGFVYFQRKWYFSLAPSFSSYFRQYQHSFWLVLQLLFSTNMFNNISELCQIAFKPSNIKGWRSFYQHTFH